MEAIKLLLCLIIFLYLLPLSTALPSSSIPNAVQKLSDSGLFSMSLTLEFGSQTIIPQSVSLTIFTPPDTVFIESGQPSLSLLRFHLSPIYLSPQRIQSFSTGVKIPNLSRDHSLIVTSSPTGVANFTINGVNIATPPIYDDGFLVIYQVDEFFSPVYNNLQCRSTISGNLTDSSLGESFEGASHALRSKGYSLMSSFLDLQVGRVGDKTLLTVFAPDDDSLSPRLGEFDEYPFLFLSHLVPCKIMGSDLVSLDNETQLVTFRGGFTMNVTRSGNDLRLNGGALVVDREIYSSSFMVVHGIKGVVVVGGSKDKRDKVTASSSSSGFRGCTVKSAREWLTFFGILMLST